MTTSTNKIANEFPRLPGGAELNILPTGTNGTSLYRSNGKVAIINNGFNIKGIARMLQICTLLPSKVDLFCRIFECYRCESNEWSISSYDAIEFNVHIRFNADRRIARTE